MRPDPAPPSAAPHRLSLVGIAAARAGVDPVFVDTPQSPSDALSDWLGCTLWLKDETDNPIGCFKGRGAHGFVAGRVAAGDRAPMVCASAGNFGLGMAHACARHGIVLTVFVSLNANAAKVDGIRRLGAAIIAAGHDFDAAKEAARHHAIEHGLHYVEDGAEPAIAEGAAGIGVELLASNVAFDAIVLPLGNGALLGGVARWVKAHAPATRMIGVCASGAPVMADSLRMPLTITGHAYRADTIADGIAVRVPVPSAVEDLRPLVDEVLLVDDAALLAAMRELHRRTGQIAEPSAVAGLAAISAQRTRFAGQRVATVLTGRNLTQTQIAEWLPSASSN
jgi:threonine dehydratase